MNRSINNSPLVPTSRAPPGFENVLTSNLTNALSDPRAGVLPDGETYRRYAAHVQTTTVIGGNKDSALRRIYYEVGRSAASANDALARLSSDALRADASFPTSTVICEDFSGLAKKYSNFSGNFARTNLAGVVERIAKGLAAVATYKDVSTKTMRAGNPYKVVALNTLGSPISASEDSVFIPRLVDSVMSADVFSVLAASVAGEGSQVVTDVVSLNNTDNTPIINDVKGPAMAKACVDALRILGANFAASDCGDLFAYAVTRGIHACVSVVGHTDEGAIMRSLLRRSGFSAPYGGIHYGFTSYVGLPALSSANLVSVAGYVDAIALKTAALVAHCDPGIFFNGGWYPTVLIAGAVQKEKRPGNHEDVKPLKKKGKTPAQIAGEASSMADTDTADPVDDAPTTAAYVIKNRGSLQQVFSPFSDAFCAGLGKLFGFQSNSGLAARHFNVCPSLLSDHERHLAFVSLAPFFWIEPTSLIPHDFLGTTAESEGFGSYASVGIEREKDAFEDIEAYSDGDLCRSFYIVKMRSARTSAFLAHWNANPLNGLGGVKVKQLDANAIIHPGPGDDNERVSDRVEDNESLAKFLWRRGQSPFAAPSELINLSGTLGIMVQHVSYDDEGELTVNHVPQHREFLNTKVVFNVSSPAGLKQGRSNFKESDCRRARTRATRELAAAILRAQVYGTPDNAEMPTLTSAPVFRRSRVPAVDFTTSHPQGSAGMASGRAQIEAGSESETGSASSTLAAPVVFQHEHHRGPPIQRGAGVSTGASSSHVHPANPSGDVTLAIPTAEGTSSAQVAADATQTAVAGEQ